MCLIDKNKLYRSVRLYKIKTHHSQEWWETLV